MYEARDILQTNNHWPVTPREAVAKKSALPELNKMMKDHNAWQNIDIDKGLDEDWKALPDNYSNHLDRSIDISDSDKSD